MGIPEEDRGPAWLRNYGTGSGTIERYDYGMTGVMEVDVQSLVDFADALEKENDLDYRPLAQTVVNDMAIETPAAPPGFEELFATMQRHRDVLVEGQAAIHHHDIAVVAFIAAARTISAKYSETDAMSAAKVRDVHALLPKATPQTLNATTSPLDTTPPVTTPTTLDTGGNV
jgi:hypothetical protein